MKPAAAGDSTWSSPPAGNLSRMLDACSMSRAKLRWKRLSP